MEEHRVPEAPDHTLPPLLVEPPWVRASGDGEPVVLKLRAPKNPTTMRWAPGMREEWLRGPYDKRRGGQDPLPDDTDWEALAEMFASGKALETGAKETVREFVGLLMQAPPELGEKLLADERYRDSYDFYPGHLWYQGAVARHGMAAYDFVLNTAKKRNPFYGLEPYLDTAVAQLMIKYFGVYPNRERAETWFRIHGADAARLAVPSALRKPGPTRRRAEDALRMLAQEQGAETIVAAARHYGDEAAEAIAALRSDPLDLYPDPLPELPAEFAPERLPQILLRGRELALPASATRHFLTMLSISKVREPYAGLPQIVDALDPESLAEFAWALYQADREPKAWASRAAKYALLEFGDDRTADRFAPIVRRWSKAYTWSAGATDALWLFRRLGTDSALRHLHTLAGKAADPERIRRFAKHGLESIAEERGLTPEQLADRIVPDLGLDAGGALTLDYGSRRFTVGFDEQLEPYVLDEDGKVRKTLPKPGAKDDETLAPAAYRRFADLKKEARTVAADQIRRLEQAMISGRAWTPEEFRSLFADHPLLRHIVRRLVWSAGPDTFRVAEDGTFADVRDDAFTLRPGTRVALPHPLLIGDVDAWSELFADYEILQPFPQLARPVHAPADDERTASRLTRFEGARVPNGPLLGLSRTGWTLGQKETGGYRRHISLKLAEDRHLVVHLDPGIRVFAPEDDPVQEFREVRLGTTSYGAGSLTLDDVGPVLASEILAVLTKLTGSAA